ncbi:MAG TPA: hypothetical protein VFU80_00765 [Sphingomicrobium sp.]|nr:hypothetical protein [Sphingomicrobium sp.]
MVRRLALFLAALIVPIAVASAQAGLPSADRMAAAERLLVAMNYDALQERMIESMIAEAEKTLPARLQGAGGEAIPPELSARLSQTIASSVRRNLTANKVENRKAILLIYAHHFTESELDHLAGLQKDPVLMKMQAELPAIMAEWNTVFAAQMQRDMPKLVDEIKKVVADHYRGRT